MARLTKTPLAEQPIFDLGGGINEAALPNDLPIRECLIAENVRVSDDGKSKQKRKGLSKIDALYDFASKKVFGIYGIEEPEEVSVAAFLEDDIQYKSGGVWGSIFSPTKTIDKQVSISQDKGLVFMAGYEKLITLKDGEAFYSGVVAPQTAPTVALQNASTDVKITEYAESNQDHAGELRALAANTLLAQSFKLEAPCDASKIKLKLRKIGSPTGTLWVEIHYARGGTSEAKETSAYIVGQATDDLDVSALTGSFETKELTFSGTKPSLSADTTYYIVVYGGGTFAVNATNFVEVGFDCSNPSYEDGKYWKIDGSLDWTGSNAVDLVFELYGYSTSSESLLQFGALETGYNYDVWTDLWKMLAQSFKLPFASTVDKIKLPVNKWYGNKSKAFPGECWVEIHSSMAGTSEDINDSANQVGDASDVIDITDMSEDFEWIEFSFSGTKPSLAADTTYYLVFYAGFDVLRYTEGNWLEWSYESGNYYADGGMWRIANDMSWIDLSGVGDFSFEVIGRATSELLFREYNFDNLDDIKGLRETTSQSILSQSFKVLKASDVSKVKLYLSRVGTPAGVMWVEIHSAQGETSASKGLSANIVGGASAASDNVDVATISPFPAYGWISFAFSGTKPTLEIDKEYYLVIYGSYGVSTSDFIKIGMDKMDPTYTNGSRLEINGTLDWTEQDFIDLMFEVYLLTSDLSGEYSYLVTFYRGGNYPCESNPSPVSEKITFTAGKSGNITNIPVSPDSHITHKKLYRTKADEADHYWLVTLENSVTTFEDSIGDGGLGDLVSYDNYVPPAGDQIEIWDDMLWVCGVEGYPEGLFRSRQNYLEQFPAPLTSYIPLREDQSDRVMRPVEFNNYLYPFKTSSIWVISRSGSDYVVDKIVDGTGTFAANSIVKCNMKEGRVLIFLTNHYRLAIMDGYGRLILPEVSNKIKKTLDGINKDYAYRSVAQNYIGRNEYRLSIPTGTSTVPNKTIVFDYMKMNFYVDTHYCNMRSLSTTNITEGRRETIFGTNNGEALKIDETVTTDNGQPIDSKFRTGWIGRSSWKELKEILIDYVLPEDKNMIFKVYSNFRETPDLSLVLPGNTPSGVDPALRDVIHKKVKTGSSGNFFSFYFGNSGDSGGEWRVGNLYLYLKKRKPKETVKAT